MVKLLLENQADANSKAPDHNGSRDIAPLSMAALNGQKQNAEQLLEHKAEVNTTDKHLDTALSIAAQHDNLEKWRNCCSRMERRCKPWTTIIGRR